MRLSRRSVTRLQWALAAIPMMLFFVHQVNEVFFVLFLASLLAWLAAGHVLSLFIDPEADE